MCGTNNALSSMSRAAQPEFYWEAIEGHKLPTGPGRGESLEVYPDGSIWWSRQVSLTLGCPVATSLGQLPFDTQKCSYVMGMYAFTLYVLVMLSQVGFLSGHYALLATSPCYNLAIASSGAS